MKVYGDQDADISYISKKVVAILGYGNQGRAQALNLRDSGVSVVVGNIEDSYAQTARSDGFEVYSPAEAAQRGDILALLVPDEVQAEVYATSIAPHIRPRQVLDFAAGYNIHFGLIRPPADVDVIMVAPRMIGVNVRRAFETGGGVPAFVDVWQNASGQGMEIALAFAKGIGATRAGVLPVSFRIAGRERLRTGGSAHGAMGDRRSGGDHDGNGAHGLIQANDLSLADESIRNPH